MKECRFYEKKKEGSVRCTGCNHFCVIGKGGIGICGVRRNENGALNMVVYGSAAALNVDPIEKKPLYHFLPGSFTYSFGTLGCNFHCDNCQNFDISQIYGSKGDLGRYEKINWGIEVTPNEIVARAKEANCKSISYTYTEPTVFVEYALDTMKIAHEKGLKNVWVSNGYMSKQVAAAIIPYIDAINIDIKSFDEKFYEKYCGAKLQPILENCKYFVEKGVWIEITTLVIPKLADKNQMLRKIATFIKNELADYVPWHLSAFSGAISWKLKDIESTSVEKLKEAYLIGKQEGLKHIYLGNVSTKLGENTQCGVCGNILIERRVFEISNKLSGRNCPRCGSGLAGIYH